MSQCHGKATDIEGNISLTESEKTEVIVHDPPGFHYVDRQTDAISY